MSLPTEEQIKEFWEWCGLKAFKKRYTTEYNHLIEKEGFFDSDGNEVVLDLNNLFKYAVPKVPNFSEVEIYQENHSWTCGLWINHKDSHQGLYVTYRDMVKGSGTEPALALFCAIWEVMHK